MREYITGNFYEFVVNYFYTTYDDEGRKKCWLSLSDGESDVKYNVPAYLYQENMDLEGSKIRCRVASIQPNGYPFLFQDKAAILRECYNDGEVYYFSALEKCVDPKSNGTYYRVLDRINGIEHRFYCDADTDIDGLNAFTVKVDGSVLRMKPATKDEAESAVLPVFPDNQFGHEDSTHEWKSSLIYPVGEDCQENPDGDKQVKVIMKSIAGLQNTDGGLLYIGVCDDGSLRGIEQDCAHLVTEDDVFKGYRQGADSFAQKINNSVSRFLGKESLENIDVKFYKQKSTGKVFCIVEAQPVQNPVFVNGNELFRRFGNGYRQLKNSEIVSFILRRSSEGVARQVFTRPMPKDCIELSPNTTTELSAPGFVVPITKAAMAKRFNTYHMAFFDDNTFLYSTQSHRNDEGCIAEVVFNNIDGNLEWSRDLLVKASKDGHVKFIQAFDMCKIGPEDTRLACKTDDILSVRVAHKYDFIKLSFNDGVDNREKYMRVVNLFEKNTEKELSTNTDGRGARHIFELKGKQAIPTSCTLTGMTVVHETLPDEILFVSPKEGSLGRGCVVGAIPDSRIY